MKVALNISVQMKVKCNDLPAEWEYHSPNSRLREVSAECGHSYPHVGGRLEGCTVTRPPQYCAITLHMHNLLLSDDSHSLRHVELLLAYFRRLTGTCES